MELFLTVPQFYYHCLLFLYFSLFGCWTFWTDLAFKLIYFFLFYFLRQFLTLFSILSLKFLNSIILLTSRGSFMLSECLFFILCFCFLSAIFSLNSLRMLTRWLFLFCFSVLKFSSAPGTLFLRVPLYHLFWPVLLRTLLTNLVTGSRPFEFKTGS